jgi:tRNA (adenine57-N1/adenine58-N1)-methyltransferase catalytic subunit
MYETLLRSHEVSQAPRLAQIDTIALKLKQLERRREDKRQRQIAASRAHRNATEKRKREGDDDDDNNAGGGVDLEAKKAKTTAAAAQSDDDTPAPDVVMDVDEGALEDQPLVTAAGDAMPPVPVSEPAPPMQVLSRHSKEVRGHTSFLTFACLLPTTRPQAATS